MQDAAYEAIGDYRFSKWKTEPKPEELPRFSTGFFQIVIVVVMLVLASAKLVLNQVNQGNFLAAKIWGYSMMAIYIVPILISPFLKHRKTAKITPPDPPPHLPSHAIHVLIKLRGQNASRGRSHGWLWVDGEWLRFSSEGFDFKLRPSDIKMKGDVVKAILRGWIYLIVPKKISPSVAYITPCVEREGRLFATPEAWSRLKPALETWTRAPQSTELSLHPPLRGNVAALSIKPLLKAAIVSTAFGLLLGSMVVLLFSEYLPKNRIGIVAATGGMPLALIASIPLQSLNNKVFDKEVDRAQAD